MHSKDSRSSATGTPRTSVLMQSVLIRRVAQPDDHLSRSLSERSADFVNDTALHNGNVHSQCEYPIEGRHDVVDWLQEKSGDLDRPDASNGKSTRRRIRR